MQFISDPNHKYIEELTVDTVTLFKLVTSEEVIATVLSEKDEYFVVKKPRLFAMQQNGDGEMFVSMLPWMMYATDPQGQMDQEFHLMKSSIAGIATAVSEEITKEYLSATSGIQLL